MNLSYVLILLSCNLLIQAKFYPANSTDLSRCKVHYSRSGSIYRDFYKISDPQDPDSLLDFHFAVLAPSDAHILLAPSVNIEKDDPAYEIVIGAGGNTFTDIRRKQKSEVKASNRTKGLLSALDPSFFWLHISKRGLIEMGKEGETTSFINWTDPDPLPLKVISFSTWAGIEAKWYFDCDREEDAKMAARNLTDLERLRRDLLFGYDPYVRPVKNASDITVVSMQLVTHFINLDEHNSAMELKGISNLAWLDEKLQWNISDYNGISEVHIFRGEIWQPDLILYNAVGDGRDILEDSLMVVQNTGLVQWNPMFHLKSWCGSNDFGAWPKDSHKCDLFFSFWADYSNIQLEFNENGSTIFDHYSSEWNIEKVEALTSSGWQDSDNKAYLDPPSLELCFTLKRDPKTYTAIFFTPFLILAASFLTSFWVSPFGPYKICMSCLNLLISATMLIGLGLYLPTHSRYVPNIVLIYTSSMVASVLHLSVAIIIINISRNNHKTSLSHCLVNILTSKILKTAFLLPDIKLAEEYGKLSQMSLPKLIENQQAMWILWGTLIDRLCFVFCVPLVIYAIWLY